MKFSGQFIGKFIVRLLRASHLAPTLLVTFIAYLLAQQLWPLPAALLIALAIFTGQLCVGWSNDLVDLSSDRAQQRRNKPLATGELSKNAAEAATFIALALTTFLSLLGPLSLRGGLLHLLGVGSGVAYNFYFKKRWLSPLPYLIAFAALPSCIVLSKNSTVPLWLILVGALLGLAAHFSNVVKDMEEDQAAGIMGAPQLLGTRWSLLIAGTSLISVSIILSRVTQQRFLIPAAIVAFIALLALPKKFTFPLIMAMALLDVALFLSAGTATLLLPS